MSGEQERARWPYIRGQRVILIGAIGIFAGTALPWLLILGELRWGSPLALSWTLWAGLITFAGAMVRWRVLVVLSAAAGGGTAIAFAVWQTYRILDRCPLSLDCLPGPGLGLLLAGGGAALYQCVQILGLRRDQS